MIVAGIEYLNEDAELFSDGSVNDATLARDTLIQRLPCAGGRSVVFYPDCRLRLVWLSCNVDIGPVKCAEGIVYLHDNGAVLNASMSELQSISGANVERGERVTLDAAGALLEYSRSLTSDQLINGLPAAAAFRVWHYANGRPSVVVLSGEAVVSGTTYPRGTELFLDEYGVPLDARTIDLDSGRQYKQRVFGVFSEFNEGF